MKVVAYMDPQAFDKESAIQWYGDEIYSTSLVTLAEAESAVKQARIDALEEAKTLIENYPFLLTAKAEICAAIESLKGKTP